MAGKRKPEIPKKKMIEALHRARGNMSVAGQLLGCTRQAVFLRAKVDKDIWEAHEEGREIMLDMAEGKLMTAIQDGDMTGIIFTLKTQGKHRGWVERQEISFDKDTDIKVSYRKAADDKVNED